MEQQVEFILQTFNGKAYTEEARGPRKVVEALFERLRGNRRIVLASKDRPAKPVWRFGSRRGPVGVTDGSKARMHATVQAYLAWANRAAVPSLTFYRDGPGEGYARNCGKPVKFVDAADFLGDAPEPEAE